MARIYVHDDIITNVTYVTYGKHQFKVLQCNNLYFIKNVAKRSHRNSCYAILIENGTAYIYKLEKESKKLISSCPVNNTDMSDLISLVEEQE